MRHVSMLTGDELKKVQFVVFDCDGVIVPRGTEIVEKNWNLIMKIKKPPEEFFSLVRKLERRFFVIISSGRSLLTLHMMFHDLLDCENVWFHAENGTGFVIYSKAQRRAMREAYGYLRCLENEGIKGFEPKEKIITIHCHKEIPRIARIAKDFGLNCLWNGEAYDILPFGISKGSLLAGKRYLAIGDRVNDLELLKGALVSVSADKDVIKNADYYADGELPGITLARKLVDLK